MAGVYRDPRFKSDEVFNYINKHFVSLKDEDMKENNKHLDQVVTKLIEIMRSEDKMFKATFRRIAHAGSYYDDLKVGKPEEFDLDVVINLPISYKDALTFHPEAAHPGYIKIKIQEDKMKDLRQHPKWSTDYKALDNWIDKQNFLYQDKFRCWIEGVVDKALNNLPRHGNDYKMQVGGFTYTLSRKKSGPAITIFIQVPAGCKIDVDLVPVLEFELPVPKGFRKTDTFEKKNWLAVAKPLGSKNTNILWRLSFYAQEREFMKGVVKPVIRQMKKMRDTLGFKNLASYYIKTLFLWELEKQKNDPEFLKLQPTCMFVYMLKKLHEACKVGGNGIRDFWYEKQNLLNKLSDKEKENWYNRLTRTTQDIDKKIEDNPYIIAEYVLTKEELKQLKEDLKLQVRTATNGTNSSSSSMSSSTQSLPATLSNVETGDPSFHWSKDVASILHSMSTKAVPVTPSTTKTPGPNKNSTLGPLHSLKNAVRPNNNGNSTQAVPSPSNVHTPGLNEIISKYLVSFKNDIEQVNTQSVPATPYNVRTADSAGEDILSLLNSMKNDIAQTKNIMTDLYQKVAAMGNEVKRTNNIVTQLCRRVAEMESVTQDLRREQTLMRRLDSMLPIPPRGIGLQNHMTLN